MVSVRSARIGCSVPSYDRKPGEPEPVTFDTTEEFGSPSFIYAPGGPDWARLPPELGGGKVYFKDRWIDAFPECPNCKKQAVEIKVSVFKDTDIFCLETLNCCKQFCWARK